ncbi:sirohydrochlorin chelatase [Thermoleptolyngbya oregonensis NK1-22]|uniref:Sirohydrochlorin chelatase n=1 Tax=Thermoleptolyngbya oregonensis NK1-22 TaxID=2547457 RepID=A0AA96Y5P6_9CYAN|nr:sirohydrochlorin chelatase [Thermoleptolyngbya oregonensis]WOB44656.1 sirohydrochlorin chelatase [Thermoleptolyngbya oregonensis NK1-22]
MPAHLPAYLLVTHGSRDPRPHAEAGVLAHQVAAELRRREAGGLPPLVETAVLELCPQPLHQRILQVATQALTLGGDRLVIIPLFLLPGVHVMEDIPAEVAIARQQASPRLSIEIAPHLGSHPRLADLLPAPNCEPAARILLAHGSRRPGGNAPVEALAQQIGAIAAYWAVPPGLADQAARLVAQGAQQVDILPFFLFPGGITEAIAQDVRDLSAQFPTCQFRLYPPFGATPQLAALVLDLATCPLGWGEARRSG